MGRLFIGIRNGKIWDKTSNLETKRLLEEDGQTPVDEKEIKYYEITDVTKTLDYWIDDTWDDINKVSLQDSPKRTEVPDKTRTDNLEDKIQELEDRIAALEGGGKIEPT